MGNTFGPVRFLNPFTFNEFSIASLERAKLACFVWFDESARDRFSGAPPVADPNNAPRNWVVGQFEL
jgi:hypothetical protein